MGRKFGPPKNFGVAPLMVPVCMSVYHSVAYLPVTSRGAMDDMQYVVATRGILIKMSNALCVGVGMKSKMAAIRSV